MYNVNFLLIGFGSIYSSLLVVANAAGAKLIAVGPLAASATVFVYAITFLITDIVSEVYGKKVANYLVIFGFLSVVMGVIIYQLAILAPAASFYTNQKAYESVFGVTWRLLTGGLIAYLVSQFLDIQLFHLIRNKTGGRHLWIRNILSTSVSQLIDTVIFITIAFYGVVDDLLPIIGGQYIIKLFIAFLDTPFAYAGVRFAEKLTYKEQRNK